MDSYRPPILASLDGSTAAEAVLPYVASLADVYGTHIFLVGVVEHEPARPLELWSNLDQTIERARTDALNRALGRAARRLRVAGLGVSAVLTHGDPASAIIALGERLHAVMIAIASHGEGGVSRVLLGSVADKVVRAGVRPTLVVPSSDEPSQLPRSMRRIVVPLDGSELAEAALGPAQQIARACHASLTLVRVVDYVRALSEGTLYLPDLAPIDGSVLAEARRYLRTQREAIAADIPCETALLRGPAFVALDEHLRTTGADLVVMTTHGRGGVRRLVLGSVADRMLRAHHPLLLIRNHYRDVLYNDETTSERHEMSAPAHEIRPPPSPKTSLPFARAPGVASSTAVGMAVLLRQPADGQRTPSARATRRRRRLICWFQCPGPILQRRGRSRPAALRRKEELATRSFAENVPQQAPAPRQREGTEGRSSAPQLSRRRRPHAAASSGSGTR